MKTWPVGIVLAGLLASEAFGQQCHISPQRSMGQTQLQQTALQYSEQGRKTAACRLFNRLRNEVEQDLAMYRRCGVTANAILVEQFMDQISDQMQELDCD